MTEEEFYAPIDEDGLVQGCASCGYDPDNCGCGMYELPAEYVPWMPPEEEVGE